MEQLPRGKYSPCLQSFEFSLNGQVLNAIGIIKAIKDGLYR